jgi:hypothetical protein
MVAMMTEKEMMARKALEGDLGIVLAKFPLSVCKSISFYIPVKPPAQPDIKFGTGTLLRIRNRQYVLTCWHVIEKYREIKRSDSSAVFAISGCYLNPEPLLAGEDRTLDYAWIKISEKHAAEIVEGSKGIGERFLNLDTWPPDSVKKGDRVAWCGFPQETLRFEEPRVFSAGSFSNGITLVDDAHKDHGACKIEPEKWVKHFHEEREPAALEGMSGGPVFEIRESEAGIWTHHFTGIIYKLHGDSRTILFRMAHAFHAPIEDE